MTRVGINGLGRIGKMVFRLIQSRSDLEVVAVNDPMMPGTLTHLMKYDTVHGRFPYDVSFDEKEKMLVVNGRPIRKYARYHPDKIPWSDHNVDVVVEASGEFLTRDVLQGHLQHGVQHVILSCPPKEPLDHMVVFGVNESTLEAHHRLISNASCTTNCIAPILRLIDDRFGIERAMMNTVHPYTSSQNVMDAPHNDLRRARCANDNIIPTTTSAIAAVKYLMPSMEGRFEGFATRVPVNDGSFVALYAHMKQKVRPGEVHELMMDASLGRLKGILEYTSDPLVSSDVIGNPHSAVYDSLSTRVVDDRLLHLLLWYDNEFGYSSRMIDLLALLAQLDKKN